jgi:hypothetical protein
MVVTFLEEKKSEKECPKKYGMDSLEAIINTLLTV